MVNQTNLDLILNILLFFMCVCVCVTQMKFLNYKSVFSQLANRFNIL